MTTRVYRDKPSAAPGKCTWTEDKACDWNTCAFVFSGAHTDQLMKFCCYCGREITWIDINGEQVL